VANLTTYHGIVLGGFPGEAMREAGEEGMWVLEEDMATAVEIHLGNPIATQLPSPAMWALP
jgi:hypothetical protein